MNSIKFEAARIHFLSGLAVVVAKAHLLTTFSSFAEPLNAHLEKNNVEYLQFAFRWMNNLLMREMPLRSTIRLWDTYLVCTVVSFGY